MTNQDFHNSVLNLNILKSIGQREGNNLSVGTTRKANKIVKLIDKLTEEEEETKKISAEKELEEEDIKLEVEKFWQEEFSHPFEPLIASFFDGIKEELVQITIGEQSIKVSPTSIIELLIERGIIVE